MDFYQDQIFRELVQELLLEPFAQRHSFHEKNLPRVCHEIESSHNSLDAKTESYQKSRDAVCLILSHLEMSGLSEMPEGTLGTFINRTGRTLSQSDSPILDAANFFRTMKLTGDATLSTQHLDRLIGQHLCLEIENQANEILIKTTTKHFSLKDLGNLAQALGLNEKLSELLFFFDEKKHESLSWEADLSLDWLSDLERNFSEAIRYLNQSLESSSIRDKAA
jgi:hypothetical protein